MRIALDLEKELTKERDPGALPQLGVLRPPGVRHLRRRADLLLQDPEGPDPGRGGHARRPGQVPLRVRPGRAPTRRRPPAGATTCWTGWPRLGYLVARRGRRRPRPSRSGCKLTNPPNDCASVAEKHEQLGLLLRLPEELVDARSRRSATTGWSGWTTLRRGGYRIVLSLDPKIQEAAEKNVGAKESTGSPFANGDRGRRAGHRPGARRWR